MESVGVMKLRHVVHDSIRHATLKAFFHKIIPTQLRHIFSRVLLCLSDSISIIAFPKFQSLNELKVKWTEYK